jgi:nucleoside-diphosphate-sugar epimerase
VSITGGSGFIGRALMKRHSALGDDVRVLSRNNSNEEMDGVEVVVGDLTQDGRYLDELVSSVDVLYHCAGEVSAEKEMHAVHVDGTRRLVEAASGNIGRWVQLSSVGAYGYRRDGVVTERSPENPVGTYEITKTDADNIVVNAAASGAFEYAILRPSIVYGADMPNQSLFNLMSMIKRGLFFYIGSNGAVVNYISAEEVVEDLIACATKPVANGKIYIASHSCGLEQAVEAIAKGLGVASPKLRLPEGPLRFLVHLVGGIPGFPLSTGRIDALTSRVVYDGGKIIRELDLQNSVSVEDGLYELAYRWNMTA